MNNSNNSYRSPNYHVNTTRTPPPTPPSYERHSDDLPVYMSFGKYKNKKIVDVATDDPSYLRWVLKELTRLNDEMRTSIRLALMAVE